MRRIRLFAIASAGLILAATFLLAAGPMWHIHAGAARAPAGDKPQTHRPLVFVMVPKGVHPYFIPVYDGFKAAAAHYGVQVEMDAPPTFDVRLQVKVIEDLIARGVDGIAISADDDAGLVDVVKRAAQAGIKVITFDAPAPSTAALTYIGTDNHAAGYEAGRWMAEAMGGTGKVAILQGGLDATNLNQRTHGFEEALARYAPGMTVTEVVNEHGDFSESVIKTERLLSSTPDLRGIFSVSAEGAPAAATVIRRAGKAGRIVVAGFDDLPDTIKGIRDGTISFCVVQNTYAMGWLSVERLLDAVHGRKIPPFIDTGALFVDRKNVDSYSEKMKRSPAGS
ncbi:MAG TPA: sugar-binding protein [Spirochaetia bacterium]|nr:sugar-binding protein [Spirochaetia bacterium]